MRARSSGDHAALDQLAERVYGELRLMARRYMNHERQGNTLQTQTALVHEVYLRPVNVGQVESRERAQHFAMAARMMRRVLADAARARGSRKRGSQAVQVIFDEPAVVAPEPNRSIMALDDALAAFSDIEPRQARVAELRYFGGLTEDEIADALEISPRTARRDWEYARVWLARELAHSSGAAA